MPEEPHERTFRTFRREHPLWHSVMAVSLTLGPFTAYGFGVLPGTETLIVYSILILDVLIYTR